MKQKKKFIKPETKVFPVHLEKLMTAESSPLNAGVTAAQGTKGTTVQYNSTGIITEDYDPDND